MTKISKVLIDHWYKVGDGNSGGGDSGGDSGGGSTSNPGGSLIPNCNLPIEDGEYDIAEVRLVNASGGVPSSSSYAAILSQDKTHVWYQRQGRFARFVIRCEATSDPYSAYGLLLFSALDLIGDEKIVPAGQTPTFAEAICTINDGSLPQTVANVGFVTPSCGFVKSKNASTAGDYIFKFGTTNQGPLTKTGQVAVISGTVVW